MLQTISNHLDSVRNFNSDIMSISVDLACEKSDHSLINNNKSRFENYKNCKNKPNSKSKIILDRIYSHRLNSNKSKRKMAFDTDKPIAWSTIDISAQNHFNRIENQIDLIHLTTSISSDNIQEKLSQDFLRKKFFNFKDNKIDLASEESLITCNQSEIYQYSAVPVIFQESPSGKSSPLLCNSSTTESCAHLTLPLIARSRKSSDDSAVDMKFIDDSSDQDRTTSSETDCSRSTSNSLLVIDDLQPEFETNSSKSSNKSYKPNNIKSSSSWRKLKVALIWTPFIQQCARRKYPWIQIAGHQGNFKSGERGTILKKHSGRESICLQNMMGDTLADFIPRFKCEVVLEGEKYICMEDLLVNFTEPSLIDIKMGIRTYLEEELIKVQHFPKPRKDLYEKMIAIDENEPTEQEHKSKAILKTRYMQWRESLSSTNTLGFRIEGIKKVKDSPQNQEYKRIKSREDVKQILKDFMDSKPKMVESYIRRLENLKKALEESSFFWNHEFIGSSLLFVHDKNEVTNIWMIDFGKTTPLPPNCKINHFSPWVAGNHEDGYLFGLNHLHNILTEIHSEIIIEAN